MDPAALIPTPDALPAHWLIFQVLLTSTAFLHIMAMNVMLGTGFIGFATHFKKGSGPNPLCNDIAKTLPFTIAFTINLGVAPLLFLQVLYGQFLYTSSVLMAVFWLSLIVLMIAAYYLTYYWDLKYQSLTIGRTIFIGLAVLLLFWVTFVFCANLSLMQVPAAWTGYFETRSGWLLNLGDKTLVPRYLHFIASAVAIGGLAIAFFYEIKRRRGASDVIPYIKTGSYWFMIATFVNFALGFLFLGSINNAIMAASTTLKGAFYVCLLGSIAAIVVAVLKTHRMKIFVAAGWASVSVFLMMLNREILRIIMLKPYFSLTDLPEKPQYGSFLVFLVAAAGAGWGIRWMLKTVCCAESQAEEVTQ